MKSLTTQQARFWCKERSLALTNKDELYFSEGRHCIAIELPEKPYQLVALAHSLLPYSETIPFGGALLWLQGWGIWNESVERAGRRVMEIMRHIHGETATLRDAPACLFGEHELVDLHVCLVQPLLIGWDAFMIPEAGDYIVATSHDETTFVISRTLNTHQRLLAELRDWSPREDEEWYFKGTEIPAASANP
jgi:hypothetical protein